MKNSEISGDQALDDLFERFRRAPDSFVFVPLADACRKMGRLEEALEICRHGVGRHPGYASGHVVMGKCFYDRGDCDEARQRFERVLELDDNNLVALKYLGMIDADAGDLDSAETYFQKILALDPDNREIGQKLREVEERAVADESGDVLMAAAPGPGDEEPVLAAPEGAPVETPGRDAEDGPPEVGPSEDDASEGGADEAPMPSDGVEASEELASITLADIFASQGYVDKAARIYREVLKKEPGNQAVRAKLAALGLGDAGDSDEPVNNPGVADDADPVDAFDEMVVPGPVEPGELERPVAPEPKPESAGGAPEVRTSLGSSGGGAAAESGDPGHGKGGEGGGESDRASGPFEEIPRAGQKAPSSEACDDTRPTIDEADSLAHFRQWLRHIQK